MNPRRRIVTVLAATCCIAALASTAQASETQFFGGVQFSLGATVVWHAPDIELTPHAGVRSDDSKRSDFVLAA
jgi:hypothetical protein